MLKQSALTPVSAVTQALQRILNAPHRKPPTWPTIQAGRVWFDSATASRDGHRTLPFSNDGNQVPAGHQLFFTCRTDVKAPFRVFWQVVNTGEAARKAQDLRGRFEEGIIESNSLKRKERAKYPGTHSIECFIVKDGYCVARTGPLIVNIVDGAGSRRI